MQGHIIQLTEKGGEIRVLGIEGTAAFREADVSGSNGFEKLTVNCEVSFLLDASGAAVDLKLLPPGVTLLRYLTVSAIAKVVWGMALDAGHAHCSPGFSCLHCMAGPHVFFYTACNVDCSTERDLNYVGTISAKEILGTLRGKIRKLPTDNGPEGPQDGIIEYEKDGSMQEVRFGAQDVNEYLSTLAVNDQVRYLRGSIFHSGSKLCILWVAQFMSCAQFEKRV